MLRQRWLFIMLSALVLGLLSGNGNAAEIPRSKLVAVYIYRLAENIQWANQAIIDKYRVHIIDSDRQIANQLKMLASIKKIHGKPFYVTFSSTSKLPTDAHVVFVARNKATSYPVIFDKAEGRNMLLISDGVANKRIVMINLIDTETKETQFEINKANIINQNLGMNPDIILLGGSEIDVAKLYHEAQVSLRQQEQNITNQKQLIEQQQNKIIEQQKRYNDQQRHHDALEIALAKQKSEIKQQEAILAQTENELVEQRIKIGSRADFLKQQQSQIDNQQTRIVLQSQQINEQQTLISTQVGSLEQQAQIISYQKNTLYLLGIIVFLAVVLAYTIYINNRRYRKMNIELHEAKDTAELANRTKSIFLANMSHELRTPLNAIMGFAQLMSQDVSIADVHRKNLGVINRSGEHLLVMINDILDLSKIEASVVELDPGAFDLHQTLKDISEMFRSRTQTRNLQFLLELDEGLARYVRTDVNKLRQIIINLLGNAVKFTEDGGVTLRAGTTKLDGGLNLHIEVEDTGIGIPTDKLKAIFEAFVQVGAEKGGAEGTGLGLSIARSFVKLMGGTLSVESEVDKGSVFRVEIPIEVAKVSDVPPIEAPHPQVLGLAPGQAQYRILIVEDDNENRLLLETLLAQVGFIVQMACNGKEAINVFQQWHPDFIWMDIRMPVMDGYEATQRIRELPDGQDVKIVALTASAYKEQEDKILTAGCNGVVYKPYKAQVIFNTLAHYLDVDYVYKQGIIESVSTKLATKPSAKAMARLPVELQAALQKAALGLDSLQCNKLLEEVVTIDPELCDGLSVLVSDFRFDEILQLFNVIGDKT